MRVGIVLAGLTPRARKMPGGVVGDRNGDRDGTPPTTTGAADVPEPAFARRRSVTAAARSFGSSNTGDKSLLPLTECRRVAVWATLSTARSPPVDRRCAPIGLKWPGRAISSQPVDHPARSSGPETAKPGRISSPPADRRVPSGGLSTAWSEVISSPPVRPVRSGGLRNGLAWHDLVTSASSSSA